LQDGLLFVQVGNLLCLDNTSLEIKSSNPFQNIGIVTTAKSSEILDGKTDNLSKSTALFIDTTKEKSLT